ncbi:MAG TPA: hypothetical protein VN538_01270 [Clostridia bacterium]|nr:hypothetical protein [Clostridia bacterium]
MSLEDAINAVVARMKTLPGVGVLVYDEEKSITDPDQFQKEFVEELKQRINGWTVLVETTQSTDRGVTVVDDRHQLVIRGWRSLNAEKNSGREFRNDVEALRQAFNKGDRKLGGACLESGPMSRRYQTSGMFAGALVHYVELTYPVRLYPV